MKKPVDLKTQRIRFLIPILRRKSLHWPARNECKKNARRAPNQYECVVCGPTKLHPGNGVHVDHIKSVINVKTSFVSFDSYVESLFCDISNLQILCITHHEQKSALENAQRELNKSRNKKKNK